MERSIRTRLEKERKLETWVGVYLQEFKMILLINICKENLHFEEFVKPIGDILNNNEIKFMTKNYKNVKNKDLGKADKIIICGTSLKDNEFLKHLNKFSWIKDFNKPSLGICGGIHILHLIYNGKKQNNKQIGIVKVNFKEEFLGMKGEKEVYNLHQYYFQSKEFNIFANKQASKHKNK